MKHFLINDWRRRGRQKRCSHAIGVAFDQVSAEERWAAESAGTQDPERLYERRWASALLEQALGRLRRDYAAGDRAVLFDSLKDYIWGSRSELSYAEAGRALGMTEVAIKVAIHRLRQRFRDILRGAIAETVSDPAEIDDELRHLIRVLAG